MDPSSESDPAEALPPAQSSHFFAVSVPKLLIMSLATAGVYELFWFYRHWQRIRERTGEVLSAPLRALFNIVFAYGLFRRVAAEAPPGQVAPLLLTLVFVAVGVASVLPLPEPWSFVGLLAVLPLLEVQSQANQVNHARTPAADRNGGFTRINVLGLIVCAAAWTLGIAGIMAMRRDPGSPANLKATVAEARRGLPRPAGEGIQLVNVSDDPRQLSYLYRVTDAVAARFRDDGYRRSASRAHVTEACGRDGSRRLLDADVALRHTYLDRGSAAVLVLTVTAADCRATAPVRSIHEPAV